MHDGNEMARNLLTQEPSRVDSHGKAASNQSIAQRKAARHNGGTAYTITTTDGGAFEIVTSGRVQWALEELRRAGHRGITSIENPAPCLSAYVHDLRGMGVEVETITEPHEGDLPGTHGRYVLRSTVTRGMQGGAI